MNPDEIQKLGNNLMGCGCMMVLIPICAAVLFLGIMFVASGLGMLD